jgi:hypothetical protein
MNTRLARCASVAALLALSLGPVLPTAAIGAGAANAARAIHYDRRTAAGTWELVGPAGFTPGMASVASFAFGDGITYVAYVDYANGERASVMKFNGAAWEQVGIAGFTGGPADFMSLAVHNGTPYMAFRDGGDFSRASLMKFNGTAWEHVGDTVFTPDIVYHISLAFGNGAPYVAYQDGQPGVAYAKASVMKFNGTAWEQVGAPGFSGDGGAYEISLAFSGGTPYVAYQDGGNGDKASVMKFNGTSWEQVGDAGFSQGAAGSTSLAFEGGAPHVAYTDRGNGRKASLMKFNGTAWEYVGPAGFTMGTAEGTRLVFGNGAPYVSYMDGSNGGRASVMTYNGSSWEQVGNAGFTADAAYALLAFGNGAPHVAFTDFSNGWKPSVMKFAGAALPPELRFAPATTLAPVGSQIPISIDIGSAGAPIAGLAGYQFNVNYNKSVLNGYFKGLYVNSFFDAASNAFKAYDPPSFNDAAGVGKYAVAKTAPTPGAPVTTYTGTGTLASVSFTATTPGVSVLSFSNVLFSDAAATGLPVSSSTATVTVYGFAIVNGTVKMQGRATPITAGPVTLVDTAGVFAGPYATTYDPTTGAFSMTVPALAAGTTYTLAADHDLYLGRFKLLTVTPGNTYAQPTTTLRGGDANNDERVSVGDLTCIGSTFGTAVPTCAGGSSDINADGIVNIFDLVIAGGNYGLPGPDPGDIGAIPW